MRGEIKIVTHGCDFILLFSSGWGESSVGFIKRVASVVFGLFEDGNFVIFVFVKMMKHVLFFLGYKETILLLSLILPFWCSALVLTFCFGLYSFRLFGEVAETLNELLGEERFVFLKAIPLSPKRSALDILNFKFDGPRRDARDADVEIVLHKIIL